MIQNDLNLFENEMLFKESIDSFNYKDTYESSFPSNFVFNQLNLSNSYNSNPDYVKSKCDNLEKKIFIIQKIEKKNRKYKYNL